MQEKSENPKPFTIGCYDKRERLGQLDTIGKDRRKVSFAI